ncbi:hypothetical protein SAMN02745975_01090 [Geosporobacter subterraneus DSM 17957]|uniref:Uncharacterized protein n=1 Tax=Geosporobacter subterraneus DSM 17957 TaxID=1121919 RepID=A0A1M6FU43_9FIRM|nr:hypothetical protein [Geosporobacter subterraneus]SHJ01185.1 hypothetical protein SAMN02745975_01090 [Geosporobacter subterraneus DSM 17957]
MNRLIPILLMIFMVFGVVTYLLHRFFQKRLWIKYTPALAAIIACFYQVVMIRTGQHTGFEDLARILMGIMLFSGFLGSLTAGLILDFLKRKGMNKKINGI